MTAKIYIGSYDVEPVLGKEHTFLMYDPNTDGDNNPATGKGMKIIRGGAGINHGYPSELSVIVELQNNVEDSRDWRRFVDNHDTPSSLHFRTISEGAAATTLWNQMWSFAQTMGKANSPASGLYDTDILYNLALSSLGQNSNSVVNSVLNAVGLNFRKLTPYNDGSTTTYKNPNEFPNHMSILDGLGNNVFTAYYYKNSLGLVEDMVFDKRGGNDTVNVEQNSRVTLYNANNSTGLTTIAMNWLYFSNVKFTQLGEQLALTYGSITKPSTAAVIADFYHDRVNNYSEGAQTTAFEFSDVHYRRGDGFDNFLSAQTITKSVLIEGFGGNDTLYGGTNNDKLYGGDGNDKLYGGTGADSLYGQNGADTLYGDTGNDWIYGGSDADIIYGGLDHDYLYGEAGVDKLYGEAGDDNLYGGIDNDLLYGGDGVDRLYGEDGNDTLDGGTGNDWLYAGLGNDTYLFGKGYGTDIISDQGGTADLIKLAAGITASDITIRAIYTYLYIYIGTESIRVDNQYNASDHSFNTASGVEKLLLSDGTSYNLNAGLMLTGSVGDESLEGTHYNDTIYGMAGNDSIYGYAGIDILYGGDGDDRLYGGLGNDTLYGDVGSDNLFGNDGDDTLDGAVGMDLLYGGLGNDTYIFRKGYGNDTISDDGGVADIIQLGAGITASDVSYKVSGTSLQISYGSDKIEIRNQYNVDHSFNGSSGGIETLIFADGTAHNLKGEFTLKGSGGNDYIDGTNYNDTIYGLAGNDSLKGYSGNDWIYGNDGLDHLYGGAGNDTLDGGAGGGYIYGEDGSDKLIGGSGADYLYGGTGNDTLYSDTKPGAYNVADILQGDDGADRFVLYGTSYGVAKPTEIKDFNHLEGDKIDIQSLVDSFDNPVDKGIHDFIHLYGSTSTQTLTVRQYYDNGPYLWQDFTVAKIYSETGALDLDTLLNNGSLIV